MADPTVIRQGGSLPFVFDRDGESIDGWTCTINLMQFPGDTPTVSRVIAASGDTWPGFLTEAETTGLAIGHWRLVGVLDKASTDEKEKPIIRFHVAKKWL